MDAQHHNKRALKIPLLVVRQSAIFIILLLNHSNSRGLEKKQELTLLHYHQKMFLIMLLFLSITSPANFETFMTEAM